MHIEMQRIVSDEGGVIIPIFNEQVQVASTKIKFENVAGNWPLEEQRYATRWWFAYASPVLFDYKI